MILKLDLIAYIRPIMLIRGYQPKNYGFHSLLLIMDPRQFRQPNKAFKSQVYSLNMSWSVLLYWFYRHLVAKSVKLSILNSPLIKTDISLNNPKKHVFCFYFYSPVVITLHKTLIKSTSYCTVMTWRLETHPAYLYPLDLHILYSSISGQ